MQRSLDNSTDLAGKLVKCLPELKGKFEKIRKDEDLYKKSKSLERHLVEAYDLAWDLRVAMSDTGKKRGRPPKKK